MSRPLSRYSGFWFFVLVWLALAGLMFLYFEDRIGRDYNPNQQVVSQVNGDTVEVQLLRNRQGHYVSTAYINGEEVVLMVDTGATRISIPEHVAERLQLEKGHPYPVNTANGTVTVWQTRIDRLAIGELTLFDLDANINPGLHDNTLLLGMNALKDLEMIQRGDTLTLRQY